MAGTPAVIYEQVKDQIGNGDILLFRGKRFYSRIIQRWTRSVYSHVGIAHWIQSDGVRRLAVVEALEGRGIHLFPLSQYIADGHAVDWFAVTDPGINRDKIVGWAMARWGRGYASPRQIVRSFFTVPVLNFLRIPTKIDRDRYFCSWFAAEALKHAGWVPSPDDTIPPELASPGDISRFACLQRRGPLILAREVER